MWVEGTFLRPLRCVCARLGFTCVVSCALWTSASEFGVSLSASREPSFNCIQIRAFLFIFLFVRDPPTQHPGAGRARRRAPRAAAGRPSATSRTCPCTARRRGARVVRRARACGRRAPVKDRAPSAFRALFVRGFSVLGASRFPLPASRDTTAQRRRDRPCPSTA